ncbi:MAG: DMT family transporter [Arenicella sp.]
MHQDSTNSGKATYIVLYLAITLLATTGLFAKGIPLDAVSLTFLRSILAATTIVAALVLSKRRVRLSNSADVLGIYGVGVLMGLHWVTFFHAMQVSTVAVGMLALFTFPVITVLFEPLFSRKALNKQDIVASLILLIGIAVMAGPNLLQPESNLFQGLAWGILSALLFVARNLLQKYRFSHVSSDRLMLHQLIAVSLLLCLFTDFGKAGEMSYRLWFSVLILGTITTAGAHTLLVMSYKRLAAKSVAMISCLQPPLASLLAWWFLGEIVPINVMLGGSIILAVALFESIRHTEP